MDNWHEMVKMDFVRLDTLLLACYFEPIKFEASRELFQAYHVSYCYIVFC